MQRSMLMAGQGKVKVKVRSRQGQLQMTLRLINTQYHNQASQEDALELAPTYDLHHVAQRHINLQRRSDTAEQLQTHLVPMLHTLHVH
jgi:hypothetical protein